MYNYLTSCFELVGCFVVISSNGGTMVGFVALVLAGIVTGGAYWLEMAEGWWLLLIFGVAWLILYILIKAAVIIGSSDSDGGGWGGGFDGGGGGWSSGD